jgi:biopolymer transport protein ExbD
MILIPVFFVLNIIFLISQISRRNKLKINLEQTKEPEEIAAFKKAIDKATTSLVITVVALISLTMLSIYILSAPSY